MALFDSVLNGVNERFNLGDKGASLLGALVAEIERQGLAAFLDKFHHARLGVLADSWVASGANSPLSQGQLKDALGAEDLNRLAKQSDVPTETAIPALALMIPQVVDLMTPDGVYPNSGTMSDGIIGREDKMATGGVAESGVPGAFEVKTETASNGNSLLKIALPLILLAFVIGIGYQTCQPNQETRFAQPGASNSTVSPSVNSNSAGNSAHSGH